MGMQSEAISLPLNWWLQPHIHHWQTPFNVIAICFYCFSCHVNLFAKYRDMESPTSKRVNKALVMAVALETLLYLLIGICGFLAFGGPCMEEVPSTTWPSCTPVNFLTSGRFDGVMGIFARVF